MQWSMYLFGSIWSIFSYNTRRGVGTVGILLNNVYIVFVFTALADEYRVGRISEVRFVLDETCSHPTKSTTQYQVVLRSWCMNTRYK